MAVAGGTLSLTKAVYDSYVICTSPRSGSTLLCTLLAASGVAGKPDSWFHSPSIAEWLESYDLQSDITVPEPVVLDKIFKAAIAKGRGDTELFGLRMQRHSFDFFVEKLNVLHPDHASDAERFRAAFGRTLFIHLTRCDKVEQAVSYVKAKQSGLWHMRPDGSDLERLSPPQPLVYDGELIRQKLDEMIAYDRDWERWFTDEGVDPLRLTYDDLAANPKRILHQVLDHLGLDPEAARDVEPGVAKLADRISLEWAERFRLEHGLS